MLKKKCKFLLNSCSPKLHCIREWLYNVGISQWQSSANLQNNNGIAISKTVRCAPSASAVSTSVNSQDYFPQLLTLRLKLFYSVFLLHNPLSTNPTFTIEIPNFYFKKSLNLTL